MTVEGLNALPVNSNWAFTEDWEAFALENRRTYEKLAEVCVKANEPVEGKVTVSCGEPGYARTDYFVLSNPIGLDTEHIALFCDGGNLCFGYRASGGFITINTD